MNPSDKYKNEPIRELQKWTHQRNTKMNPSENYKNEPIREIQKWTHQRNTKMECAIWQALKMFFLAVEASSSHPNSLLQSNHFGLFSTRDISFLALNPYANTETFWYGADRILYTWKRKIAPVSFFLYFFLIGIYLSLFLTSIFLSFLPVYSFLSFLPLLWTKQEKIPVRYDTMRDETRQGETGR